MRSPRKVDRQLKALCLSEVFATEPPFIAQANWTGNKYNVLLKKDFFHDQSNFTSVPPFS